MKKLFFLCFLASCSTSNPTFDSNNKILNFDEDLSFNEFNNLLIEYVKISPYPNIE